MKTAIVVLALVAAVAGQRYVDPKQAAILQEARYLSGDGSFGSAYNQEDGTQFKEETDASGNRRGQYSYIDNEGKTITVQYTAGKNGFQVSGDHLPKAPAPVVPSGPAPPRQYTPQPQYNPAQQPAQYKGGNNDDGQYRPEVYEAPYQYNNNLHTQNYPDQQAPVQNYHHNVPAQNPASGYNPFHNPHVPAHLYQQDSNTTPSPNRFFPPGKLSLSRSADGFQYQFNSN